MTHWLHGMFTALVTPFDGSGIDLPAFERVIGWQIAQGVEGVVVGSATGEASTLSAAERLSLLTTARRIAGRDYPVVAAIGSYATDATVAEAMAAERAGASALLLRMPYYSRPTQAGLLAHIAAVAGATTREIILDNDPDRCGVEIASASLAALAGCMNVVAVLERRGDLSRCEEIARLRGGRFLRLTGRAETIAAYLCAGGCGAVTSIGNIAPHWLSRIGRMARCELHGQAQMLQRRLLPLLDVLAAEPDPVPVKLALSWLHPGFGPACRLPLVAADPSIHPRLRSALEELPGLSAIRGSTIPERSMALTASP